MLRGSDFRWLAWPVLVGLVLKLCLCVFKWSTVATVVFSGFVGSERFETFMENMGFLFCLRDMRTSHPATSCKMLLRSMFTRFLSNRRTTCIVLSRLVWLIECKNKQKMWKFLLSLMLCTWIWINWLLRSHLSNSSTIYLWLAEGVWHFFVQACFPVIVNLVAWLACHWNSGAALIWLLGFDSACRGQANATINMYLYVNKSTVFLPYVGCYRAV